MPSAARNLLKHRQMLSRLGKLIRRAVRLRGGYVPERHYMRGAGPACQRRGGA